MNAIVKSATICGCKLSKAEKKNHETLGHGGLI